MRQMPSFDHCAEDCKGGVSNMAAICQPKRQIEITRDFGCAMVGMERRPTAKHETYPSQKSLAKNDEDLTCGNQR